MTAWSEHKVRSAETWAEVRRGWEAGETGASLARRYDVGLANLWRRRAAEGWERYPGADPSPEPLEGWVRTARRKLDEWERQLEATRELALDLMQALEGGTIDKISAWHMGWMYHQRAKRLGPEVAARDREKARDRPWFDAFWDEAGRLHRVPILDRETLRLFRAEWREGGPAGWGGGGLAGDRRRGLDEQPVQYRTGRHDRQADRHPRRKRWRRG